jgi:hypothetical protein
MENNNITHNNDDDNNLEEKRTLMNPMIMMTALSLMIVLVGCSDNMNNFNGIQENNYRTGSEGLAMSIDGPSKITVYGEEEATFPESYSVKIENKGATDIKNEYFYSIVSLQNRMEFVNALGKNDNSNAMKILSLDSYSAPKVLAGRSKYSSKGDKGQYD